MGVAIMGKRGPFTKVLAIVGTVLVWVPIVAPLVFTRWGGIGTERFNFDWLIPAELAPVMLVGGGLLLWAALRAHSRRALVGWGLGVAIGSIVIGAVLTRVTGLATGATEPTGILWVALVGPIVVLVGATLELGIAGVMLTVDLFARHETASPPVAPTA
jgi:hypothetical protein